MFVGNIQLLRRAGKKRASSTERETAATAPLTPYPALMKRNGCASNVVPLFTVFHTPPCAVPTYQILVLGS